MQTNTITKDSYRRHNHYTIYTHKTICLIVYIFVRTPRRVPQLCGICPDIQQSVLPFKSDFCSDSQQTSPYIIWGPVVFNCLQTLHPKKSCCAPCPYTFPLISLWLHHICFPIKLSAIWTFQAFLCTLPLSPSHAHISYQRHFTQKQIKNQKNLFPSHPYL